MYSCHSCPVEEPMASLHTYIQRQFSRWTRKVLEAPRPKRMRNTVRLSVEGLEDRVVFSGNPIVAENQLPGTPQSVWDVPGEGDPTIQGYSTNISVNEGQT